MIEINQQTHLINNISFIPSPNWDERPIGVTIDLLVIHGISLPPGEFGGDYISALFTNALDSQLHPYFAQIEHLKVSSHLLIRRDGQIVQYVPFHKRAWHAGESNFKGRSRCNDFSIGIELEGADTVPYTPEQYQSLAKVTQALLKGYPGIDRDRIVGHSDIAPGRKTDPGTAFNWEHFFKLLE